MDKSTFAHRFEEAAARARECARPFVLEKLPDPLVFRVRLNASCDDDPLQRDEVRRAMEMIVGSHSIRSRIRCS